MCPSVQTSVHLSVTLSPPKPLAGIQPNLLHHCPLRQGCVRAIFFPCVHCPSITLSPPKPLGGIQPYLLHPLMIRVHESNIIFLCVIHPSVHHAISSYGGPAKSFVTWFSLLQCYVLSNIFLLQTFKVSPLYWNSFLQPFYPVAKSRKIVFFWYLLETLINSTAKRTYRRILISRKHFL